MAPVEPPPAGSSAMTYEQLRQAKMQATQRAFAELQSLSADLTQETRRQAGEKQQQPRRSWTRRKLFDKVRRSGRLQNAPATQYLELDDRTPECSTARISAGRRTWQLRSMGSSAGSAEAGMVVRCGKEVYTEEDLRKLRGHVKPYGINVERYKNRVYDPVNGKSCHQCRQKTLGLRTECAACKDRSVCGQFCGDCLFLRYGENIEEALADPEWECPVCRDICNCSICRNRKGWGPTGQLFHKVWGAGYQSVAHYLMLTRMAKGGENTGERTDGDEVEEGNGSEEVGGAEGGSEGAGGESEEGDEEEGSEEEGERERSEITLIEECKDGNEKSRTRKRKGGVERSAMETRGGKQGLGRKKKCVIRKGEEEEEDVVEVQVCRTVVQVKEEREEGEMGGGLEIEWTKMRAVKEEEKKEQEEVEEVEEEEEVERKEEEGLRRTGQVKVKTENTPTARGKEAFGGCGTSKWCIKKGSLVEIATTGAGAGSEVKREESEVKRESGILTRRAAARLEAEAAKCRAADARVLRSRIIHSPRTGGAAGACRAGAGGAGAAAGRAGVAAGGPYKRSGTKSGLETVVRSAVKGIGKGGSREEVEEDKVQLRHLQKDEEYDSDDDVIEVVVARTV
ncbi:unnamed protein product [Closterium sp. Naga37s-1]|nr:unnamed protein product [Closterium sp. Naga37s-1]